ncbi:L-serine ammonia-lyase [Exophiala mesophila]|uniref:L-serine ammonia-lyase n=1 Tax=Exophiala mesophila TaxID=212818 RepID=A0A0D1Z3J3_EXOME|nr:L-serine ammonia-lyase [Exophiala mesophila]KIV89347.1 L-serine ammonia-lyase [Exophiala mesophila]
MAHHAHARASALLACRLARPARRPICGQTCRSIGGFGGVGASMNGRLRNRSARPVAGVPVYSPQSLRGMMTAAQQQSSDEDGDGNSQRETDESSEGDQEHAIISAFDLFSVGIGPSSSHTVGPMRAGNIFVTDLIDANILPNVTRIRISIYGSLALTGEGHMTPSALLLGLEGANVETVDTAYVPARFEEIKKSKKLILAGSGSSVTREIDFDYNRDFIWEWARKLPMHSNGMRLRVFDKNGDMLATNDLFSVGGGFVINGKMSTAPSPEDASSQDKSGASPDSASTNRENHPADLTENLFYKEINRSNASGERRTGLDHDLRSQTPSTDQTQDLVTTQPGSKALDVENADQVKSPPRHAPYLFRNAADLLALCRQHNLTIAQLMYENEKGLGLQDMEIFDKLFNLWDVMDNCIREGVQAPSHAALPGALKLRRRAPALYQQLTRGLYPEHHQVRSPSSGSSPQLQDSSSTGTDAAAIVSQTGASSQAPTTRRTASFPPRRRQPRLQGSLNHPISVSPVRSATLPAMDYLTVYAIAVNETNAAGGRVVTAPTNGAAGIIPAVLKYVVEFVSDDPERDIPIFLLTAAAIASLFKRGATISAAEGGCMAEVGVACSMAAGAYAACMGAGPETIEQAAEIGIEHNLGLTCDPVAGLVQAPCIERNALGAVKAVASANLALNSVAGLQKVSLDDAIRAMRLTAKGMKDEFKETSLSGLATSVPLNIPVSVPDC